MRPLRITIDSLIDLDYEEVSRLLSEFIANRVREAGAKGVVVGVSGGVDSATTLALAVKALGPERVHALIMPDTRTTPRDDVRDAWDLVKAFNVANVREIPIDDKVDAVVSVIPDAPRVAVGNVRARMRMLILYYYANTYNLLVLGTGDRSEFLIGYFTKYGDGAADIYPLAVLYKTQVRHLAKYLGVPDRVAFKPSAPRLWPGHEAEKELGLRYEEIDLALHAMFDYGLSVEEAAEATGLPVETVRRVYEMHVRTRHKRECFAAPPLEAVKRAWRGLQRLQASGSR